MGQKNPGEAQTPPRDERHSVIQAGAYCGQGVSPLANTVVPITFVVGSAP